MWSPFSKSCVHKEVIGCAFFLIKKGCLILHHISQKVLKVSLLLCWSQAFLILGPALWNLESSSVHRVYVNHCSRHLASGNQSLPTHGQLVPFCPYRDCLLCLRDFLGYMFSFFTDPHKLGKLQLNPIQVLICICNFPKYKDSECTFFPPERSQDIL